MLPLDTLYSAETLAVKMAENGHGLVPISGSVLDKLIDSAFNYKLMNGQQIVGSASLMDEPSDVISSNGTYEMHEASKMLSADGVATHDAVLEEVTDVVAKTVTNIIDFARNTVSPLVQELTTAVEARLQETTLARVMPVAILQDQYKEIWTNPVLISMVEAYADRPIIELKSVVLAPSYPAATVMGLLTTGAESYDAAVKVFTDELGEDFITQAFDKYFTLNKWSVPFEQALNPYTGIRDEFILVYLFANRLLSDTPEGIDMPLETYRLRLTELKAEAGRCIAKVQSLRERNVRNRSLVISFPNGDLESARAGEDFVIVNSEVYQAWLTAGGDANVLLGSYITDRETGFTALLDRAELYRTNWARQERLFNSAVRAEATNATLSAIRVVVSTYIRSAGDADLAASRETLQARLNDAISALPESMIGSLYHAVRRVVCRTLFAHTDAERILLAIDAQAAANPGIEIRDAALLATIDIVSWWVSQLMIPAL